MVWSTVFQERAAERDGEDADPREETDSVSEDDEDDQGILFKAINTLWHFLKGKINGLVIWYAAILEY